MKWNKVLNPGKTLVDLSDQLMCALTKELRFRQSEFFTQYFPIFRQLRIELPLLVIYWQFIEGSILVQIYSENKFSMIGLPAFVHVNNIMRARYTLHITLCALFIKLWEAASASETDLSSYEWLTQKYSNTSFLFWKCAIDQQINVLLYDRSIQTTCWSTLQIITLLFSIWPLYICSLGSHTLLRPLYHWNKISRYLQLLFKRKLFIRISHRERV